MSGRNGPGGTGTAHRPGGWLSGLATLGGLLMARSVLRWFRNGQTGHPPRVRQASVQAGHETRETPVWQPIVGIVLVLLGVGGALIVATVFQAAWVGQPLTFDSPPGRATPGLPPPPPEPRLEEVSGAQIRAYLAAEQQILMSTAWIDRQAGIARIPVDRAIDLLTEQPLPARPADGVPPSAPAAAGPPSGSSSGRVSTGGRP